MSFTKKCTWCGKRKTENKFYIWSKECTDCTKIRNKARYMKMKIDNQIKKCEVVEMNAPKLETPNYPAIIFFVLLLASVWVNLYHFFS